MISSPRGLPGRLRFSRFAQMVQFIKQEAEEKANEIRVASEEVRATLHRLHT